MTRRVLILCIGFILASVTSASVYAAVFDVKTYGAVGDGKMLDTPAINKAIEEAAAAGGGTVHFPAGTYLSGSIRLKSHVALYLSHGAVIEATSDANAYDPPEPNEWGDKYQYQDFGHSHWHNSLIWGENLEDISILGPGRLYGKGLSRGLGRSNPVGGNKTIALKLCRNVTIRDITIQQAGHFGILPTGVDNFTIDNVRIDTNRDGINIDCCRNVRISNCSINTPNDDGLVLKSSYALGYARATENVTITNCQLSGYSLGSFLDGTLKRSQQPAPDHDGPTGRIKFGTESNGGFKNITISNCVFDNCRGLALETVDGGLLEDVTVTNITMRGIVNAPIFLRLGSRMRGPQGVPVGELRRVNISNINVYDADPRYASIISGIPGHNVEDVKLSNIRIIYQGGGTKEQAEIMPPEKENQYPEPSMFGVMPAYGFFIRHVKGIELSDIHISFIKDDFRPAFVLDDVKDADFRSIKAQHNSDVPIFSLKKVEGFRLHQCEGLADTKLETIEQGKL